MFSEFGGRDERASAPLAHNPALVRQFGQRLADGGSADSELVAQHEVAGDQVAGLPRTAGYPVLERLLDLDVKRQWARPVHAKGSLGGSSAPASHQEPIPVQRS